MYLLRATAWLVTLTFVATFLSPARADDAASLLAKHRAFVGWQFGDGSIITMVLDGNVVRSQNGVPHTIYTLHAAQAGIAKRTTQVGDDGRRTDHGFTGKIFWATDSNGFIRPELGGQQKYDISRDIVFDEATTGFPGQLRDTATVDGVATTIVRIAPDAGDPIDLYIDPSTGAYRRIVIDPDGTYETSIDVLSYGEVLPGKKIISRWTETGSDEIVSWSKMQGNAPVTSADLHPPQPTAQWSFDGHPFPITVNDEQQSNMRSNDESGEHAITVDASFNGVKGRFIIDTGASSIFLTSRYAAGIGATDVANGSSGGVGSNRLKTTLLRVKAMQIGGNVLSNVLVSSGKVDFGPSIDGLIGYDLFGGAIGDMNLDTQQLTLYDPATYSPDASKGVNLTVDLSTGQPRIPMKMDAIDVTAILDSGNSGDVDFSPVMRNKYGLVFLVTRDETMSGIGGNEVEHCGRVNAISVGPIVYDNAPACESPSFSGRDILVGFDFLKNFNFIFNYPQAQLLLIPRNH